MTRHSISDPRALTARQAEILAAFASGEQQKQIAHRLALSARTVEKHIENVKAAVGAKTLAHAAALWAAGKIQVRQS